MYHPLLSWTFPLQVTTKLLLAAADKGRLEDVRLQLELGALVNSKERV